MIVQLRKGTILGILKKSSPSSPYSFDKCHTDGKNKLQMVKKCILSHITD